MQEQCAKAGDTGKKFQSLFPALERLSLVGKERNKQSRGISWHGEATPAPGCKEELSEIYQQVSSISSRSRGPHKIRNWIFKYPNTLDTPQILLNKQGMALTELGPGRQRRPGNEPGKLSNSDISFAS